MKTIKIALTGAAGHIGYAAVFRLASGAIFGPDVAVELQLLEVEPAMHALYGVQMELHDCAFLNLHKITLTTDPNVAFRDADWILLVGASPRKAGMERKDLIRKNAGIFIEQGKAIEESAGDDVRILTIGNPCNTNCLIAKSHAPRIPRDRWFAMTHLDVNRSKFQLATKAGVLSKDVRNMAIWGNHSATQYPDFYNATILGKPVPEVIGDLNWLQEDFIQCIQKRGASIIKARGASSAASAANAILNTIQRLSNPTPKDHYFSSSVPSDGSYGIPEGLVFSFPLNVQGDSYEIVQGVQHNEFAQRKLNESLAELEAERDAVRDLMG